MSGNFFAGGFRNIVERNPSLSLRFHTGIFAVVLSQATQQRKSSVDVDDLLYAVTPCSLVEAMQTTAPLWRLETQRKGMVITMKKVLILEGSPRRNGNSAILSEEFARGAKEAGCDVEKVRIAGKKIAGCLGCNGCYRNGG